LPLADHPSPLAYEHSDMGNEVVPVNYLPILVFIGIAIAFGAVSLLAGWVVRPSRPYRAKLIPYESGSPLFQDARVQFPIRYYIIAMLFVIFDIETVFIFPWAVVFNQLGLFGLVEMLLFIVILLVGYFYAWKKGALEWD
jgi:NADH-quinone oxidoreductase subunit A